MEKQKNYIEPSQLKEHIGKEISIKGSIYKIRKMKGFAFVLIRTPQSIVQGIYTEETAKDSIETLKEESCCIIHAKVVAEERAKMGYELHLTKIQVLSEPKETGGHFHRKAS